MEAPQKPLNEIKSKYRGLLGDAVDAEVLDRLIDDVAGEVVRFIEGGTESVSQPVPFDIGWMDSYLAHWVVGSSLESDRSADVAATLQQLVDLQFDRRLSDIRDFIEGIRASGPGGEPPDAGPPEPGVPPGGPSSVFEPSDGGSAPGGVPPAGPASLVFEPPDAGPPEPGVPPAGPSGGGPDGGPPDGGPPDGGPPEPGVPPAGPDPAILRENPWILYWFVSVQAPMLLDMIDAHFERRLGELGFERR